MLAASWRGKWSTYLYEEYRKNSWVNCSSLTIDTIQICFPQAFANHGKFLSVGSSSALTVVYEGADTMWIERSQIEPTADS